MNHFQLSRSLLLSFCLTLFLLAPVTHAGYTDGKWHDIGNGWEYLFSASNPTFGGNIGVYKHQGYFRFYYNYSSQQWNDWSNAANTWSKLGPAGTSSNEWLGDGNWHNFSDGRSYLYTDHISVWKDQGYYRFYYNYLAGLWHGFANGPNIWSDIGATGVSAEYLGDSKWHTVGNDLQYLYYKHSSVWKVNDKFRFYHNYLAGQWMDYSDATATWSNIGSSGLTSAFIGDGTPHNMGKGYQFTYDKGSDKARFLWDAGHDYRKSMSTGSWEQLIGESWESSWASLVKTPQLIERDGQSYFYNQEGMWQYNPQTNTFTKVFTGTGTFPISSSLLLNGQFYYGDDDGSGGRDIWRYDPSTNLSNVVFDCSQYDLVPGGSNYTSYNIADGRLYISLREEFYRYPEYNFKNQTFLYEPGTNSVTRVSAPFNGVIQYTTLNGDIYIYSHLQNSFYIKSWVLYRYDPDRDKTTAIVVSDQHPLNITSLTAINEKLYFIDALGLKRYDPDTNVVTMLCQGADQSRITLLDGDIYFRYGGYIRRYDPDSNSIKNVFEAENIKIQDFTAANGDLYFTYSTGSSTKLWRYDPDNNTSVSVFGGTGSVSSVYSKLGDLYFYYDDGNGGRDFWRYDPRRSDL